MSQPHAIAARLIESQFEDKGGAVLAEAGFATWDDALAGLPAKLLQVPQGAENPAEALLVRVRNWWTGKHVWRPAVAATRGILRLRVKRFGNDHPDSFTELGALGTLADRTGRKDEARKMLEGAYEGLRNAVGESDVRVAVVAANLANHLLRAGEEGRAVGLLRQAWQIRKEVKPGTEGVVAAQLAEMHIKNGDEGTAVDLLRDAWYTLKDKLGIKHPRTRRVGRHLATGLTRQKKVLAAEPVLRELYDSAKEMGDDEEIALSAIDLGLGLQNVNLKEEALRLIEESVRITRRLGDPHPQLSNRLSILSRVVIIERKRPAEGEGILREALEVDVRLYGEGSPEVAGRYAQLGHLCAQLGRVDEAMGYLDPAAMLLRTARGDRHPQTRLAVQYLVDLLLAQAIAANKRKDRGLAQAYVGRAMEIGGPVLGHDHVTMRQIRDLQR